MLVASRLCKAGGTRPLTFIMQPCRYTTYKFDQYESDQYRNITGHGIANRPSLIQTDRRPISGTHYKYNYGWQQILNGLYNKMSVNRESMVFDLVSKVIDK